MRVIAHRSGTDKFPEQTLLSAKNSLEKGVYLTEVDVRFTLDRVCVVSHDSNIKRLHGILKEVDEMSAAEFLALKRKEDGKSVNSTFEDFLKAGIKDMLLHIKEGGEKNLSVIIGLCRKYGAENNVVFGVQSIEDLDIVKRLAPEIKILAFMPHPECVKDFAAADFIRLWEKWCSPANISAVRKTGCKLWIMSDSPSVGEVTDGCYEFYENCGADAVLVNKVIPALEFYGKGE